ncbi:MAG: hypothetical protein HYR63_24465 [Proteobacteria bacterium]|nr:hypothetical protein [Pseudomonadota bacterium]
MTTLSVMGAFSSATASTVSASALNTFARQLTSTGNAVLSGTSLLLTAAVFTANGNFLSFVLPSGMTFAANPTIAFSTSATSSVSLSTGGSGSQSVVYQTGTNGFTAGATLTLSGIQVSGLQSYISTNSTATFFNVTTTFPNDAATSAAPGNGGTQFPIASLTDAASATPAAGAAVTIDVSSGGVRFVSGTANALFVPIGTVAYANPATAPNDIGGGSPVSMSAQGGNIVVTGPLTGLSTVYAVATAVASTCATAAPSGAFTVTPSATAGTLTGLSVSTFQVCAIANGSTILSNGTIATRGTITTSSNTTITGTSTTNAVGYSGNVRNMQYFVGATGGYSAFAYAVNSGTSASTALVSVRRNDGATATGSLSSLAAGASALYGASDINTAIGSTFLVDASSRAQVTFLFSGSSVNITGLLLNPGGVVTGFGQQFSN